MQTLTNHQNGEYYWAVLFEIVSIKDKNGKKIKKIIWLEREITSISETFSHKGKKNNPPDDPNIDDSEWNDLINRLGQFLEEKNNTQNDGTNKKDNRPWRYITIDIEQCAKTASRIYSRSLNELIEIIREHFPFEYAQPVRWIKCIHLEYHTDDGIYYAFPRKLPPAWTLKLPEYFKNKYLKPTSIKVPEAYRTEYAQIATEHMLYQWN